MKMLGAAQGKMFVLVTAMTLLGVVGLVVCEGKGYEEPLNCKKLECPSYEVIDSQKEYEIRSYKNALWMSTPIINSTSYKDGSNRGFDILFAYIQGNNRQAAKINMTAPVLVDINPSNSKYSDTSTFGVYFYLPQKYQNNPPPLSDQASPVMLPRHKKYAAVRRFGGFLNDSSIPPQAVALKKSLKGTSWESAAQADGGSGDSSFVPCTVAGYNSPYEQDNRVNEVLFWFEKS